MNGEKQTGSGLTSGAVAHLKDLFLEQLDALLDEMELQSWQSGQILFYAGHKPLGVYILESGRVAMEFPGRSEDEHYLMPERYGIVGLDFVLAGADYPFTARALTPVKAWFINRRRLAEIYPGERMG